MIWRTWSSTIGNYPTQPFGRRGNGPVLSDGMGDPLLALRQHTAILSHAREEGWPLDGLSLIFVGGRQGLPHAVRGAQC